jgi:hypothetical protein
MFYLKELKKNLVFKSSYRNVLTFYPCLSPVKYTEEEHPNKMTTAEINLLLPLFGLIASCLIFGMENGN